jgi:integrase/recombinase XerC
MADEMHPLAEQFLSELAIQRRASRHTLDAYRRDLFRLHRLALEVAPSSPPDKLTTAQLRRGLMQLHAQNLAARSIARTLSAWRSFYAWLLRRGVIAHNPAEPLKAPKRPRTLPKALGIDQMAALLDAEPKNDLEVRDAAMFELFYSSGLRLAELVSLDWPGGLNLAAEEITVTGKRQKTRSIPLGSKAKTALLAWVAVRPNYAPAEQTALFTSRSGTRLSPRQVEKRLERWAQRQGLGMQVHPHMLRHSFASHVLQSSGDLRAVQDMLGHASIAATQIYTHLDFQHLAKIYDAAHPRAKKV